MAAEEIAPIIATVAVMAIPLAAILTAHQRKMAMIFHGQRQEQSTANNDAVVNEIRELKQVVYQQAIALDNLKNEVRQSVNTTVPPQPLSVRLGQDPPST